MSAASKATFAASCLFFVSSAVYVAYEQVTERQNLRQGPIKDAERMRQKLSQKQQHNQAEHAEQAALRAHYESVQPLDSRVIRGVDEDQKKD